MHLFRYSYFPILLALSFLMFFVNLDVLYVNIMEARNFITAREMVSHNHWFLTSLNNLPRYEKPPLPTWLTAFSGMLFGFKNVAAMRFPAALSSILLLVYFYKFIPLFKISKKQAFLSGLILITSFYIIFSGRNGQWDIFSHAFMMGCIYYFWKFWKVEKQQLKHAILAGCFFAASFMSKGPVSHYALFLPFLISFGIVYKFENFRNRWRNLILFLLVGIILGGWWFVYVRWTDPAAFLKITTQETQRWGSYNIRPFYYYWSFVVQSGIWTLPAFVALLYPYLKDKVSNKKAYLFSLLWTLLSVILLSIIPEKKSRYLLPVLIPMAMNTGFYIEYLFRRFKSLPKKESWIVYFNHGLIGFLGIAFPVAAYFVLDLKGFWFWYLASSVVLFGIGLGIFIFLRKRNYPRVFYLTVAFIFGIILFAFPLANSFLDNPKFHNISELEPYSKKHQLPIYENSSFTPELIWEYGEPIPIRERKLSDFKQYHRFGLLISPTDSISLDDLKENFKIISTQRYDLNYVNPQADGYKERLIREFYILEPSP